MDQQTNEQKSSSTEGGEVSERKYREVTEGDIGKLIEVTDYGQQFKYRTWKEKRLSKVLEVSSYPFSTTSGEYFRYARIEVQGE
jgi:hypothetical protein